MGFFSKITHALNPGNIVHQLGNLDRGVNQLVRGKSLGTISRGLPGGKMEKTIGSLAAGYFTGGAAAGALGGGLAGAAAGGALGGATAGGLNNVNYDKPLTRNIGRNALIGAGTGAALYGAGQAFGTGGGAGAGAGVGGTPTGYDPATGAFTGDMLPGTTPSGEAWTSGGSGSGGGTEAGIGATGVSGVPGASVGAMPFASATGAPGGPVSAPVQTASAGGFDVHGDPIVGGPASATGGGDPNQLDYTLGPTTQPGLNANGPANPMVGPKPGIMERIMGGFTGKNTLKYGLPLAYAGMTALNSKKALPGEAQASAQADQFHNMGTRDINNANAGVLQPWQDAQINTFKQQQGASAKQMMVNLGMDPSASSSMLGLNAAIEQQSQQIRGGFLTQGFNQGMQEMAIGDQAQQQYVQLQLQRRQELSSAMTNAMTTMAFMAMM